MQLTAALEPDEVLIGGGNVGHLDKLPPKSRRGDNADAFEGGFRLWGEDHKGHTRRASEDDPQHKIKSNKIGRSAAHKGGALEHAGR
jgi:hypothetical protein